jgi:hypothetical protein
MVNHGIGVDTLNQVSFVPADIVANNIVAISTTPGTANKTYHVVRDDYSNMTDITGLITKATGRQFEAFSLPDFVPELIRRCRKEDLLFPLLDFLVGSVDNISAMEFKRYDSTSYQKARDASVWGKADPSLEDTVNGILKFMYRKGIISVAAREVNAVRPIRERELSVSARIKTHRRGRDCGPDCLQCLAVAADPECLDEIPRIAASEQV